MSVEYVYVTKVPIPVELALQCRDNLRASFSNFFDFSPQDEQFADFKVKSTWPDFVVPGLRVESLTIMADAGKELGHHERLVQTLEDASQHLPGQSSFQVECNFEELESEQKPSVYDYVNIGYSRALPFFGYHGRASRIANDAHYRREAFKKMIEKLDLPLALHNSGGDFFLEHLISSELRRTYDEANPDGFNCDIPGRKPEQLVNNMESFLADYAKPEKRRWSWSVNCRSTPEEPELSAKVYKWIKDGGVPMSKAEIVVSYVLEAIEAVEGLKGLAGKKRFDTHLCQITFTEDEVEGYADVLIRTMADGHRLVVRFHHHEPRKVMPRIREVLGLELESNNTCA